MIQKWMFLTCLCKTNSIQWTKRFNHSSYNRVIESKMDTTSFSHSRWRRKQQQEKHFRKALRPWSMIALTQKFLSSYSSYQNRAFAKMLRKYLHRFSTFNLRSISFSSVLHQFTKACAKYLLLLFALHRIFFSVYVEEV